jgi:hypothetical protein
VGRISKRGVVKVYHVELQQDDGWYIGRVLERAGVTTHGQKPGRVGLHGAGRDPAHVGRAKRSVGADRLASDPRAGQAKDTGLKLPIYWELRCGQATVATESLVAGTA